jgi:hypothetical protein
MVEVGGVPGVTVVDRGALWVGLVPGMRAIRAAETEVVGYRICR